MATHLPTRPQGPPADLALPPERLADWDAIVTSADLPQAYDPPAGFIASANNRGAEAAVPVGWFFSADDRVLRLQALVGRLIAGGGKLDAADLMAVQQDVYMASADALNAALLARIDQAGIVPPAGQRRGAGARRNAGLGRTFHRGFGRRRGLFRDRRQFPAGVLRRGRPCGGRGQRPAGEPGRRRSGRGAAGHPGRTAAGRAGRRRRRGRQLRDLGGDAPPGPAAPDGPGAGPGRAATGSATTRPPAAARP